MANTIGEMKVGERLFLGTYGVRAGNKYKISWLKATRDNKFLSEFALDYLTFDRLEPIPGRAHYYRQSNSNYALSNIFQYLNGNEDGGQWFAEVHEADWAPDYLDKPGFLNGFEDYEVASLLGGVDLPTTEDIVGVRRFELFNRKALRPKASRDMLENGTFGFDGTMYIDFLTQTPFDERNIFIIGRDGQERSCAASKASGLRPKCCINPSAKITKSEGGMGYVLVPFAVEEESNVCAFDDIMQLLGLQ